VELVASEPTTSSMPWSFKGSGDDFQAVSNRNIGQKRRIRLFPANFRPRTERKIGRVAWAGASDLF
jgi:hypothetical protein